jgi:hypothetical protein
MYESETKLADGRSVWLQRKMFTWAIVIGPTDADCYDDHWCFETRDRAVKALAEWNPMINPEPDGWIRNPRTGRRRPDGDASKEYVSW